MKIRIFIVMLMLVGFSLNGLAIESVVKTEPQMEEIPASEKLVVLWTSGDK